jgi:hypothetical protein
MRNDYLMNTSGKLTFFAPSAPARPQQSEGGCILFATFAIKKSGYALGMSTSLYPTHARKKSINNGFGKPFLESNDG